MSESYINGYRFGVAYASNRGMTALLRIALNPARFHPSTPHEYRAGVVDAALAVVQGAK
jgi:hypothetical protein